jgi:hypothetical protein
MLPPEVSKVLLHDFKDLLSSDLTTITKYDPLNVPNAVKLYTENVPEMDPDVDDMTNAVVSDDIDMKIPPLNAEIEKAGKMVEDVQDEILNENNNITDIDIADKNMTDEELVLLQQAEQDDIQADVEMLNKDVPEKPLVNDENLENTDSSDDDNADMDVDIDSGPPARNLRSNPPKTVRFDKNVSKFNY